MQIENMKVSDLIPYARNSRVHDDAQVNQIASSIREFGFLNPVIVDADGTIIAGHGRVQAARKLSLNEVPCVRAGHLTEDQKRAYIIADNKIAENAEWDSEMLTLEMLTLKEDDFDIELLGFSDKELKDLLPEPLEESETKAPNDIQYGGATSISRASAPYKFWKENGYLKGDVLDFGVGREEHDYAKYDPFTHPDVAPLHGVYDTVMCNFVLNVQPADHLITQILVLLSKLVKPEGNVLIAVRNDLKESYLSNSGWQVSKGLNEWNELIGDVFWTEAAEKTSFYGFVCKPLAELERQPDSG